MDISHPHEFQSKYKYIPSTSNISINEIRVFYLPTLADLIGHSENESPFNDRCVTNAADLLIHQGRSADDCRVLVVGGLPYKHSPWWWGVL